LGRLKAVRDKKIAHHEIAELPGSTYAQINLLLGFAKDFVSTIGMPYMQTVYQWDDGKYVLSVDAEAASRNMRRLLKNAGIALEKDFKVS
jgi:hypothetical protein